jgi:hypothetical protein
MARGASVRPTFALEPAMVIPIALTRAWRSSRAKVTAVDEPQAQPAGKCECGCQPLLCLDEDPGT